MTPPALPPRRAVVLLNDPVLRSTTARALAEGGWRVNLAQSSLRRLMGWLDEEATSLPELIVCGWCAPPSGWPTCAACAWPA